MMVTSDNNSDTKEIGFGARLKSAREALKLSDKDVASRLHLNPRIIHIIETENFSDGPPMIFLRGYIRSYAKLLNVPADDIMKALPQIEVTPSPAAAVNTPRRKMATRHAPRYLMRWTTYLIVIVLMALVAMWWKRTHPNNVLLNKNTEMPAETISQNTANGTPIVAMNNVQAVQAPKGQLKPVPGAAGNSNKAPGEITISGSDPDAPPSSVIQPIGPNKATGATNETSAPAANTDLSAAQGANTNPAIMQADPNAAAPTQNSAENTATPSPNAMANNAPSSITEPKSDTTANAPDLPPANSSETAKAVSPNTLPEPQPSAQTEAARKPAPADLHPEQDLAQAKMDLPEPGLEESNNTTEDVY